MKALLSVRTGGPETLELTELPPLRPGPDELLVRVGVCSINFPDTLIIEDKYQLKPERPFAPGGEIAGVVEAVGDGVSAWSVGDRLIASILFGGLSEQVLVRADEAIRIPDKGDLMQAATLMIAYGTTLHALTDRGRLKVGDTLLVLGAAGGVGLSAVEIGKAIGARVIAAVSSKEKAAAAMKAGADETLIYGPGPFDKDGQKALATAFKHAVGPMGADVIYDPVGGDYAEPALRSIAWEGRYLVVGFPGGIPRLPLNLTLLKSCDVCGVYWGAFIAREPEKHRSNVAQLLKWWKEGVIRPRIDSVYPLERGGEAIARLSERGVIGKVLVQMGGAN